MFKLLKSITLILISIGITSNATADEYTSYYENLEYQKTLNSLKGVTINVGMSTIPPFVIVKSDDYTEPMGVDVDIFRELQKRLGFSMPNNKFVYTSTNDKYQLLYDNKIDIITGGISATPQRAKLFDFSPSYYQSALAVIINADNKNKIKSIDDLDKRTISAEYGINILDLFSGNQKIDVKNYLTTFSCIYAVENHDVDATIFDYPTAKYYVNSWKNGHLTIAGEPFGMSDTTKIVFLYNKNFKYKKEFDVVINEMKRDGTIDNILKRYI